MQKHGTPRSKLPGTEARADRKNGSSPRLDDSGSESESESDYETDSDSDTNEAPSCEGTSHGLSNLASTSESSCNDSLPKDSDKHTKLRISDALSCLTSQQSDITTDEYILPNTSITQSPPAQVMDRNTASPDSSFCSKSSSATGSADSVESLFSLRINSNSFTNHIFKAGAILESGEFFQIEELESSSSMNKSDDLVKLRQPSFEASGPNISIGETIASKYVDHHEAFIVSEELPLADHPTSHQNEFVLPLNFPKSKELMNGNKKTKKKKKKKKKGGCEFCFCCKCPSCSLKCLSCWGCCMCPTLCSCCCQLPSCCKCSSCSCCSCKSIWSLWDC